jgi:serine/threonine protein kinase
MIDRDTRLADRYVLREHLGGGGAGDVWLATDETLQRPVAVKVLRQGTAEERQRFESESRAQAPLSHPSIVRVFDVGTHEERPFLVMAHVDGRALSTVLSDGPLSSERVTRLGGQLSEALAHAHERGVIHRDVKPGNVLVDDNDYAYLTDFGIARHSDSATVTAPGRFVGSAAYVAPEQARGETVTAAADVYSLGLVLLEALTGRQEYPGTAIEAASARLHRSPEVPAELPAPWPGLLADMTADSPTARPAAADVASRLAHPSPENEAATQSEPEATTQLDTGATAQVAAASHAEPPAADDGAVVPPAESEEIASHRERDRSPWPPATVVIAVIVVAVALIAGAVLLPGDDEPPTAGDPVTLEQAMDRLEETIQP